jgi:excisionase family DNA binding protein
MMQTRYMTPKEVGKELEVSPATVTRWFRNGTIPGHRFGPRTIKILRTVVEQLQNPGQTVEMDRR